MFTVEQIQQAHSKVKSGADFPNYIQDLIQLGVLRFETFVSDSHSDYYGANGYRTSSEGKYAPIAITDKLDIETFKKELKEHQQGKTDYMGFIESCAKNGIVKWIMDLKEFTCIYYDPKGNAVLTEIVPH
ncbi:DUF1398 domain-containing protein [Flavobacterium sp. PLA-1-15]|uniref:DUF1398 domain-containing protein n=1 Tax=Flavobacterium sp. PLA-1-15 TaxID=3380533 RepID=UPI003B7CB0A7